MVVAMNDLRQFELLEELRPGESAKAILLRWDGAHYVRSRDEIDLFEFVGTRGERGDRGYARFSPESRHWELMSNLFQRGANWLPF
jgi:hypothetical protein